MNNTISIVIPTYGHWPDLTHQLLLDIYQNNREADEIIIINDGHEKVKEIYDGIDWWRENRLLPQIKFLDLKENVGFLRACNKGISKVKNDIVILVSNDVRLQDNIVSLVRNVFKSNSKLILGGILYETSTGWNEFKDKKGKPKVFPYLEGWLLVFTKKAWDELEGFDEIYAPNDMEDVDFSTKAIDKGYALSALSSTKLRHLSGQTLGFFPEREALTKRNRKLFAEKWKVTE